MHCLVIDDNPKTSATLVSLLESMDIVSSVQPAVQPYQVRSLITDVNLTIDIIFIRVRLWNHELFASLEQMPAVVFLTGGRDKLTEKPTTTVPYRLREPFRAFDLELLMGRLQQHQVREQPAFFFISYEGRYHRIFFKDIELIERMRMSYVRIYTTDTVYLVSGTLTGWIQRLPADKFVRVSDTLVLPIEEVKKINGSEYDYKGRIITLTFRFAKQAKKEMSRQDDYSLLPTF